MKKITISFTIFLLLSSCHKYLNYSDFDWTYPINIDYKSNALISSDTLIFGYYRKSIKYFSIKNGKFIYVNENMFDTRLELDLKAHPENETVNYIGNIYSEMKKQGVFKKSYVFPLADNIYLEKLELIHRDNSLIVHTDHQIFLKIKRKSHLLSKKIHVKEWKDINAIQNIYISNNHVMIIYFDKIYENFTDTSFIGLLDLNKLFSK
jgi:hypothetical protein